MGRQAVARAWRYPSKIFWHHKPGKRISPDLRATYQAALRWIAENTESEKGICTTHSQRKGYPEVTGYFIPTLLQWGEHPRAEQYARWLLSIQNANGSWSDADGKSPYTFDTGQVLKGLFAIRSRLPLVDPAIRRGCDWLLTQIAPDGRVTTPDKSDWSLAGGRMIPESIHLYALEPLRAAGRLWAEPRYLAAVERALSYYLAQPELTAFDTLSHFHAYILEALVDLGHADVAARAMANVARSQGSDGAAPAYAGADWTCSTGLAQYAVVWYKLGDLTPARKAFECVCRLQNRSGGFFGSYGRGGTYFPDQEISWAVKYFLDAYYWHVRTTFDNQVAGEIILDTIDERDGRMQAVLRGLGDVARQRVLDAGCGKGRFAKILAAKYPAAEVWGVDLSDRMLAQVPAGIKTVQGSLLNLPFADGQFDAVFSVETLEHSVNPAAAVQELCRVAKKGGPVIIVDKNVERQGTLKTEAWERWFSRSEVEAWLSGHCTGVTSKFVSYGEEPNRADLFIVWEATRS